MLLLDLHTHHPGHGATEIQSLHLGQPEHPAAARYSVGLHPWWSGGLHLPTAEEQLFEYLARPDYVAVGEAGLDKVCKTEWTDQLQAFQRCIHVSEQVQKPLILHVVKSYEEILTIKKKTSAEQPWIIHGFDKHPQTGRMLLAAGLYLSFGAALLKEKSHAAAALAVCADGQFFLETDNMADSTVLEKIYQKAAEVRNCRLEDLVEIQRQNWVRMGFIL